MNLEIHVEDKSVRTYGLDMEVAKHVIHAFVSALGFSINLEDIKAPSDGDEFIYLDAYENGVNEKQVYITYFYPNH